MEVTVECVCTTCGAIDQYPEKLIRWQDHKLGFVPCNDPVCADTCKGMVVEATTGVDPITFLTLRHYATRTND